MLEIGVQSRGIIRESVVEEGYKKITQSGMTCVDYNIVIPKGEDHLDIAYYKKHRACAVKHGLRFAQVHAPIINYESEYPDKMKYIQTEMKKSIEICSILKSPFIVMHPYKLPFGMKWEEKRRINVEFFESLAEIAIEHSVIICIENMPYRHNGRILEGFCSDAHTLKELIELLNDRVGTECFAACFDTGHANVLGRNFREEIRTFGKYLKVLHIHDNDGYTDSHQLPYSFSSDKTGGCTTDWSGFLLGLREINYSGVLSFETYRSFTGMPGVLQDAMLKFIYSIGTNFSDIICFEETLKLLDRKKKILFGAGKMFDVYMKEFGDKYPPDFAVDNNVALWGTAKMGVPIRNPQEICDLSQSDRTVIICNAFYEEIIVQLKDMGIKDYILTEEILRMNGKPL